MHMTQMPKTTVVQILSMTHSILFLQLLFPFLVLFAQCYDYVHLQAY